MYINLCKIEKALKLELHDYKDYKEYGVSTKRIEIVSGDNQ